MQRKIFQSLLFFLILSCGSQAFAQNTELPYQDTRKKREGFLKLQPRDVRADVATFALGGISESVGTTPLPQINYTDFGNDFMSFEGEGLRATIRTAPFSPEGHRLDYDEKYLIKIDRKPYYGNYGSVPKTFIQNISLIVDGDSIEIPPIAYSDLFNLNLMYSDKGTRRTRNAVYRSKDGSRIYLYAFSKDNTGSYEVTWIFQDKKYVRRVLDYDITN